MYLKKQIVVLWCLTSKLTYPEIQIIISFKMFVNVKQLDLKNWVKKTLLKAESGTLVAPTKGFKMCHFKSYQILHRIPFKGRVLMLNPCMHWAGWEWCHILVISTATLTPAMCHLGTSWTLALTWLHAELELITYWQLGSHSNMNN